MSAIANITISDGQATPVVKTFSPVDLKNDIAKWADRSGGIAIGFPKLTMSLSEPSAARRSYKLTLKVVTPVLEVTSPSTATGIQPAPTKAYDLISSHEFVLPERSTLAQRRDLLAFASNLLANAAVVSAVQNFEAVY